MMETVYLSKEDLLQYYDETIQQSGGGMAEVRDGGGLDKVLEFVMDDDYYPTFEDKLTYLVLHSVINHEDMDEGTKLEVIHAMEKSPLYSENDF